VGQGDATFVALPSGHTILVDAGGSGRQLPDTGTRTVLPYIRILGYRRVDVLVATHDDADHLAGIAELVPYLRPSQIWAGALDPSKKLVRSLREGAAQVGATVMHPDQPPGRLAAGSGSRQVSIETLPRPPELTGNDASLVLRICDGAFCALLVGDAEAPREVDLLASGANLSATLLKVGHHGSKTSTTPAFLAAVAPRIAHIELGRDNKFGFPHAEVTARLDGAAVWTDRTDQGSALVVASDGAHWWRESPLDARGW
jgi:competence protein ComEC